MVERVEDESFRLGCPRFADGFIGGQALEGLQPSAEVVCGNEVVEVPAELVVAIRAVGAKLIFLPPYSLDLNPIERAFAKLKTLLRKADARSVEATRRSIGTVLDNFSPQRCANYFTNAEYASS